MEEYLDRVGPLITVLDIDKDGRVVGSWVGVEAKKRRCTVGTVTHRLIQPSHLRSGTHEVTFDCLIGRNHKCEG